MNIALIVHFTPQTLREVRGGGHVVLSSDRWREAKRNREATWATNPPHNNRHGRERKRWGEEVCVCGDIL